MMEGGFVNQDKMYLINKIFNNETIRTVWDKEQEKYFISVIDIVGVLADSSEPRKYWNWLKNKLKNEENFETSSITRQLKLKAQDGKYRSSRAGDDLVWAVLSDYAHSAGYDDQLHHQWGNQGDASFRGRDSEQRGRAAETVSL